MHLCAKCKVCFYYLSYYLCAKCVSAAFISFIYFNDIHSRLYLTVSPVFLFFKFNVTCNKCLFTTFVLEMKAILCFVVISYVS